ncbi:4be9c331-3a30-49d4-bdac-116fd0d5d68c [Sclerotinia trifoliorum]|uniref:Carboxypeptidase n=1 Tax=Sclerotinia trifoliorum TaxID=28548 RepID=A0A8H2VSL5_9HELO|nr:4be9c331-3a30-49d4-bdac-116fd0d5d68c [Sclerotinia trifoliorum]
MLYSLFISVLLPITFAQYPPISNLTRITSPVDGNITISYKTPPTGTCQTVFDSQEQYTGWVNIPGSYATNTFFWFISARDPTDQLTIWLNGGPGSSSMIGLFNENGPCEVINVAQGKFATEARDWGWDRASNMLYIDQPNQVGFSYDTPTNCSVDLLTTDLYTPQQTLPKSQPADTFLNGTFSSLNVNNTANTTQLAGMAIWHMLQGFLGAFPQYAPNNKSAMNIHLFAESYGGKYGPAFATLWEEQNAKRANGTISQSKTIDIKLKSLGIINGCVDDLIQAPYYPDFAVNNTFGLSAINPTRAKLATANFYASGGCKDLITQCRTAVESQDPTNKGNVSNVNSACSNAYNSCVTNVMEPYYDAGRSVYDISHNLPDSFPPSTYLEYLNSAQFQSAIGSPVNYTETNFQVVSAFTSTGDYERKSYVPEIAALVKSGIHVGLMYGDRDYICNWFGGEAISLAVAKQASSEYALKFPAAGYAPIITNTSYIGGVVRQFGNLSFSRIYDAGHSIPAYQPETAFQVFARIIMGTSVSTGETIDSTVYNTTGPLNATHTTSLPASPTNTCYLRSIPETCTEEERDMIIAGKGAIIDGVLYSDSSDYSAPTSTITVASSGSARTASVTTTTEILTGLFTATATPSPRRSFAVPVAKVDFTVLVSSIFGALGLSYSFI